MSSSIRSVIAGLSNEAISGSWQDQPSPSLLSVMGRHSVRAHDVPAAMEMIGLLAHFSQIMEIYEVEFENSNKNISLIPGIFWGQSRIILLIEVAPDNLDVVAYWIADKLPSKQLRSMPGILALPFTIEHLKKEEASSKPILFPEWFSVFYPHINPDRAFPILNFRSVLSDETIGKDWVQAAAIRMFFYCLPYKTWSAGY